MAMKINTEGLHERWLSEFSAFSNEYLTLKNGKGTQTGLFVIDYNVNNAYEFEVKHQVSLPKGAGKLCLEFAKAAQTYIAYMAPEDVINHEIKEFPKSTFCLYSLLYASYPRNTKSSIFKRNVAGTLVLTMSEGEMSPEVDNDLSRHIAFAGLGVTLLKAFRSAVCPLLSDDKAIEAADGYYVSIPT